MTGHAGPYIGPFLLILIGLIMAGAGIFLVLMTFGHIGKTYDVVTERDKGGLWGAVIMILVGIFLIGVAVVLSTTGAAAQESGPPSWGVRAQISACPPYNPSACENTPPIWIERSWCGKRAKGWTPQKGVLIVTVRCGQ